MDELPEEGFTQGTRTPTVLTRLPPLSVRTNGAGTGRRPK